MNHQLPSSTKLKDISDFTFALRESALYINDVIRENTSLAQEKQQMNYNRFVKNRAEFKIGDIVKINNYKTRVGFSKATSPEIVIQDTSSHYVAPENTLLDIIITGNQLKILKKRRAEHLLRGI
jgi:hypothetical protein